MKKTIGYMGHNTKKDFSAGTEKLQAESRQIFKMRQKLCVKVKLYNFFEF